MAVPVQLNWRAIKGTGMVALDVENAIPASNPDDVSGHSVRAVVLHYPRQGAMVGTERNVLIADALNEASEKVNEQLRRFCS